MEIKCFYKPPLLTEIVDIDVRDCTKIGTALTS